jgi:ABC-2 type transport system ATP-binding protein
MTNALEVKGLERRMGKFRLGPIDLEIEQGKVIGLVGPNGAGKSTLIHNIAGFLRPKTGTVSLFGEQVSFSDGDWKERIGYAGESSHFFERWKVRKNFELLAGLYPGWSARLVDSLVERMKLDTTLSVNSLSRGNRMKLALIAALAYKPKLLLFDEPADGLDPEIRAEMITVLREMMQDEDRTILFATHHLEEFSSIVDEIVFLSEGKIKWRGGSDVLADRWRRITFSQEGFEHEIRKSVDHKHEGNDHRLISYNRDTTIEHLNSLGVTELHESRMDLDEIIKWMMKGGENVVAG